MEAIITKPATALECLEVRTAGQKGRGVFATAPIAKGTFISPVSGWPLRTAQLTEDLMALQVDHDLWLCSNGEFMDDYINHSCEPNVGFLNGTLEFYALRDINTGEEISFDYSTSLSDETWQMPCACSSPHCRSTILPWGRLTPELRQRLLPAAMGYLRPVK